MKPTVQFNFARYPKRRIALLLLYMGWKFDGFVVQADTENTVEEHLLRAMLKTKLIETREGCGWTRCGRTDKGVTAFRQVVAVTVRSTDVNSEDSFWPESSFKCQNRITSTTELPYVKMLNSVLIKYVRVLAYSPVHKEFSARFDCLQRVYTYVFPRAFINDISLLQVACNKLTGTHDFRNFCHIDRNKDRLTMSYVRTILSACIEPVSGTSSTASREPKLTNHFDLLKLTVKANGFLWHQIRCIVSLLWEIASGNEEPEIIDELFDLEKFPARPQYKLANALPLCLFDCSFPDERIKWKFDENSLCSVIATLQGLWAEYQIKAENIKAMIDALSDVHAPMQTGLDEFVRSGPASQNYVPLRKRPCCDSLEERRRKSELKKQKEIE